MSGDVEEADCEKALEAEQEPYYEPIHRRSRDDAQEPTRTSSRVSARRPSLSTLPPVARVRSQNGHGCADLEESGGPEDMPPQDRPELEKDSFEVSWDGDDDPMCPRSLPLFQKWTMVVIVGMGSFCVTAGSSIYTATYAQMNPEFGISGIVGTLGLSTFAWTIIDEPIKRILRSAAYLPRFLGDARFLDGFAGSAFLSVAGGTTMLIWSFVLYVLIIFFAPETYHPIKLREKARALRKDTGDDRWKAPMEKSTKSIARKVGLSLLRPFQLLIFEPMCLLLCVFSAILLGVLYLFFGAFGVIFGDNYGFNLWQTGLSFLGILVGMIVCSATDPLWRLGHVRLIQRNHGVPEPEFRLPPAIAGAILVPIGLFWFAWTTYPHVHWIMPIIGSGIFAAGTLLVFTGIFTFLVDAYPLYAASALAANSFVRCAFAGKSSISYTGRRLMG
ncbi:hypothetical protein DL762_006055 [Monosporascus cannonballus]|uniref:Major facilitator superfamily (MFS) profile domain-containing protein n=1 Tax=Monosporascus cannonballus TaxID=155416 RepID=A0ABY0H3N0_9PEZI|nr:hypothetical protein DL762_006055 [Monosporascus cannonballus]